ncbi:ArnT family glycosyltransferase [Patescibacteria group bacterium]
MQKLKKIIKSNKPLLFTFLGFFTIHLLLLNINFAEWGDSYRILRASEHLREFTYPEDEKRPPLFSLLLALRPPSIDQVLWGRLEMLGISFITLIVFYKLLKVMKFSEEFAIFALWLLILNPVHLYWSLRIMADVPFGLIALVVIFLLKKWDKEITFGKATLIGLVLGLGVLTRFEGYILGLSVGMGILLDNISSLKDFNSLKKVFTTYIFIGLGFFTITLPWFIYRNPFQSSYFEEPQNRIYDLNMVVIYVLSVAFIFGLIYAPFIFFKGKTEIINMLKNNKVLAIFVLFELFLALMWPAAIPRLFTPAVPFLIIIFVQGLRMYLKSSSKLCRYDYIALLIIFGIYVVGQYFYKLQFLVLIKSLFLISILLQTVVIVSFLKKASTKLMYVSVVSMFIWSVSIVLLHKDIFKPVVLANQYVVKNIHGKIAYNDVSSVSDWYLNQKSKTDNVSGTYLNMDSKTGRTYDVIRNKEVDYIMITNEHNPNLEFSADDANYLEEIAEFRYTIRGKEFFTKIVKFNKTN